VRHIADRNAFGENDNFSKVLFLKNVKIADNVAVVRKSSLHLGPMTIVNERLQLGL
jgi:hypothetical protein